MEAVESGISMLFLGARRIIGAPFYLTCLVLVSVQARIKYLSYHCLEEYYSSLGYLHLTNRQNN